MQSSTRTTIPVSGRISDPTEGSTRRRIRGTSRTLITSALSRRRRFRRRRVLPSPGGLRSRASVCPPGFQKPARSLGPRRPGNSPRRAIHVSLCRSECANACGREATQLAVASAPERIENGNVFVAAQLHLRGVSKLVPDPREVKNFLQCFLQILRRSLLDCPPALSLSLSLVAVPHAAWRFSHARYVSATASTSSRRSKASRPWTAAFSATHASIESCEPPRGRD